jgi:hypothetical protein
MSMMLLLLIVGAILLIIGYLVPMPAPLGVIIRVAGCICLAVGVILLIVALVGGGTAITVHNGLPALHV